MAGERRRPTGPGLGALVDLCHPVGRLVILSVSELNITDGHRFSVILCFSGLLDEAMTDELFGQPLYEEMAFYPDRVDQRSQ